MAQFSVEIVRLASSALGGNHQGKLLHLPDAWLTSRLGTPIELTAPPQAR